MKRKLWFVLNYKRSEMGNLKLNYLESGKNTYVKGIGKKKVYLDAEEFF